MKTGEKVLVGLAALVVGGLVVYLLTRSTAQATTTPTETPAVCPW